MEKLRRHGFTLSEDEVHSPAHACRAYLTANDLRPHLLGSSMLTEVYFQTCYQRVISCVQEMFRLCHRLSYPGH